MPVNSYTSRSSPEPPRFSIFNSIMSNPRCSIEAIIEATSGLRQACMPGALSHRP